MLIFKHFCLEFYIPCMHCYNQYIKKIKIEMFDHSFMYVVCTYILQDTLL